MDKYEIIRKIEKFALPETAEKWDCSGWLVETAKKQVNKIMLALTITDEVYTQAQKENCDMIISHHPLFNVPIKYRNTDMYCAHTNMDFAVGGTTDTLIERLKKSGLIVKNVVTEESFVRYVETELSFEDLCKILSVVSPNFRYIKADKNCIFKKLAFCAGSGSEFIEEAFLNDADGFVTGDLKFHTALDSPIPVFDIGHFESEIQILDVFENIIGKEIQVIKAQEESPFKFYS